MLAVLLTWARRPAIVGHMPRDADAPIDRDTSATIRIRKDRFDLMTRIAGAPTPAARAALIGVDRKTIRRALAGSVGEVFMANTVTALRRHSVTLAANGLAPTLDELFEVVAVEVVPVESKTEAAA